MNGQPVPPWIYRRDNDPATHTITAADPPTVEDASWRIAAAVSDHGGVPIVLAMGCIAGMVIIAILAFLAGRAS